MGRLSDQRWGSATQCVEVTGQYSIYVSKNQFAVKMLTDVQSGIAPVKWQSYEGPVLAYRPQIEYEDAKHFNRFDYEVISKPDYFGFQNKSTSQAWKVENICKEFKLQPEKQNILWEEFWIKDEIFYYLISQRFLRL